VLVCVRACVCACAAAAAVCVDAAAYSAAHVFIFASLLSPRTTGVAVFIAKSAVRTL